VVHCGILQYSSPASSKLPQCATACHLHPTLSRPISGQGSTHESAEGQVSRRMYFGMNRCRQPYFADVRGMWPCALSGVVRHLGMFMSARVGARPVCYNVS
jgi:hypothetical protein